MPFPILIDGAGCLFAQYSIPEVPVGSYSVQARDAFGDLLAESLRDGTSLMHLSSDRSFRAPALQH